VNVIERFMRLVTRIDTGRAPGLSAGGLCPGSQGASGPATPAHPSAGADARMILSHGGWTAAPSAVNAMPARARRFSISSPAAAPRPGSSASSCPAGRSKESFRLPARGCLLAVTVSAGTLLAPSVAAHDFRLGPLRIDHPYATPTPPGAANGAAYLRALRNTGDQPDRLIGASTPVARTVEIHHSVIDSRDVMRMRAIDGIALPPGAEVRLRHGGEHHLMLLDLKQALKAGDRFPLTLRFEKAGEREVMVWVQQPRAAAGAHSHKH
jgi:copper(I)-binding protein